MGFRHIAHILARALLAACMVGPLLSGCATQRTAPALLAYDGQEGGLQLFVHPADAEVYVDGDRVGQVSDFQGDSVLWLPRGLHAVEVSKTGYHTLFRQVQTSLGLVEILVYTLSPSAERP